MEAKFVISGVLPSLNDYIAAERSHRQKAAAMKRQAEHTVAIYARKQLRNVRFTRPVYMAYRWVEPNRKRDKDNISSYGRKVIQDALVRCKILQNDNWACIAGYVDEFDVDKGNPRIEVKIWEV